MPLIARDNNVFSAENDLLTFGKYKGETIGTVILSDPEYVDWLKKNSSFFKLSAELEVLLDNQFEDNPSPDMEPDYGGYEFDDDLPF